MKVLILTASYGSGHVIAAKALDEAFREKGIEPVVFDVVEKGGKTEKTAAKFYEFLMKRGHFVWKLYHEHVMPIRKGNSIRYVFEKIHKQKFFKDIEKINPDLIVSTMDTASVVASLFKRDHPQVKIATVVTDFVAHQIWVWKNMDFYFVASKDLKKDLIGQGIREETIFTTGIPLRSQFQKIPGKNEARKKLQIPDDKTVVLISAGTFNSVPVKEIVAALSSQSNSFAIILTGGKVNNVPLYASLLQEHGVIGKVVDYTDDMVSFMVASDLYVSKAGGLTVAECLACSLPAIYFNNFPGHEAGNAQHVAEHKAGIVCKKEALKDVIEDLLRNPKKVQEMRRFAKELSHPNAARDIVNKLL